MLPDGAGEFFFRNGKTGDTWCQDFRLGHWLPREAIAKLRLFQPACRSTGR
jgi:hypothetical protein